MIQRKHLKVGMNEIEARFYDGATVSWRRVIVERIRKVHWPGYRPHFEVDVQLFPRPVGARNYPRRLSRLRRIASNAKGLE